MLHKINLFTMESVGRLNKNLAVTPSLQIMEGGVPLVCTVPHIKKSVVRSGLSIRR